MHGQSFRRLPTGFGVLICSISFCAAIPAVAEILPPGFRPRPVGVHALVGGRVVTKPGETLDDATIVIRDGYIEAVGKNISAPDDARVWDAKGLTIYAGFIESYLPISQTNQPISTSDSEPINARSLTSGGVGFLGVPGQKTDAGQGGPGYQVAKITPETRAVRSYTPDKKIIEPLRELGFTAAVIAPSRGIVRGTSALVELAEADPNELVLKSDVFQHVAFETHQSDESAYPGSLMGTIAVVRQSFFDAQHYSLDQADWQKKPSGRARPEYNPSLEVLGASSDGKQRVMFEPGSALMVDRSARVAQELKLNFAIVSCGQEWRRPDLAKETGATFIVPVNFPNLPKLPSEDDWEQVTLDNLRAWDWAAENPALLRQQKLDIALTTYSLADKKVFRKNVKAAVERGLSETDALAALTTIPAKLCGVEKQLGTIEPGKIANLTIVDGKGYFDPESRVREVWVDGRNYHVQAAKEEAKKDVELKELQNKRVARNPMEGRETVTVVIRELPDTDHRTNPPKIGEKIHNTMNPPAIWIQNATIWTCGVTGRLEHANLMIRSNTISGCWTNLGAVVLGQQTFKINATGLHITPGLIDAHSHAAILGAVNEPTLPSTAMVRIGDVVNSETKNISEQLAGGLTTANLLHGSANPIGGQNQIIKLRDGASPEGMKFEDAPQGIKFALGENVKQSNWGEKFTTRFPQTRMGVPTFYRNRFTAAQQYLVGRASRLSGGTNADNSGKMPSDQTGKMPVPLASLVPQRRDLELEAIGEIIEGKRLIHCHSYRQDEILAFLRVIESFGVRVATLQHVLEGYKVADEIAKHGAGASCFADWWAYKFEVYDAIPFAGSLMRERGVLVSFNSDSSDLARRMNTEAAKAVKYGGTSEEEALKFVTINAAKQLGIDKRVGSLEPGKDADFVVWSGHPLDSRSVVLQTWIDGKKYFDRDEAVKRAAALKQEREDLIAKAKKLTKLAGGGGGNDGGGKDDGSFFRVSLEHEFDGVERHCMEGEH